MGLILLTLSLLCVASARAQSGYPGSGPTQDPGHYWKITYSQTGTWSYTYYDSYARTRTPQSGSWGTLTSPNNTSGGGDGHGYSSVLSGLTDGTVTATLTWVPAAGNPADPPSSPVHIKEYAKAGWAAAWDANGSATPSDADYTGTGADDGLGDPVVNGTSEGWHLIQRDGASGSIVLTCSLYAHNPASVWKASSYPGGGYPGGDGYPGSAQGDWTWSGGGLITTNFSVSIDDKQRKLNVSCPALDPTSYKIADPKTPKDANGDSNYVPTPHIPADDGTMSGDVGLPIASPGAGPTPLTNITYHANLLGTWQTAGSSYNWFSSLKQQGDSGSLYPPDFTNSYLDPWWVDSQTPGGARRLALNDGDPSKPDHIHITCTDGGDGSVATANYYMTLHPSMEQNYPDHVTRGIENLRKAKNASYVRATQNDSTLTVYAEQSDSWGVSASTDGSIGDFIAANLGISLSASYSYSYNAGVQTSLAHVPLGFATYLEEFDAYKYHTGKADLWNMSGYAGTAPYHVKEPDSPSGGYQAHSPPIYLGAGGTP